MSKNQPIPKKKTSAVSKTSSTSDDAQLGIQQLLQMLQPLMNFHAASEDATDNDLRIYWDVRIIRGRDEPFLNTKGSSSLPGALSEKMRPLSTSLLQKEISDKIAAPLVGALQAMVESDTFVRMEESLRVTRVSSDHRSPVGLMGADALELAKGLPTFEA